MLDLLAILEDQGGRGSSVFVIDDLRPYRFSQFVYTTTLEPTVFVPSLLGTVFSVGRGLGPFRDRVPDRVGFPF